MVLISKRLGKKSGFRDSRDLLNQDRSKTFTHTEQIVTCSGCRQTRCRICTPGPCKNCRSVHVKRSTYRC